MRLTESVLLTIGYSFQFEDPLTAEQIHQRLIGCRHSLTQVIEELNLLQQRGELIEHRGFYTLSRCPSLVDWVQQKHRRQHESQLKRERAAVAARTLGQLPFVLGVALTGSVSVDAADSAHDIDLLVVTQPMTVWLVRPMALVASILQSAYRPRTRELANSWCMNIFISTDSLRLSPSSESLYTAYEVCQADFLYDQGRIADCFIHQNAWVEQYLPNWFATKSDNSAETERCVRQSWSDQALAVLLLPLSVVAYLVQTLWMYRHQTRETVGFERAFFHPRNVGQTIFDRLEQSMLTRMKQG